MPLVSPLILCENIMNAVVKIILVLCSSVTCGALLFAGLVRWPLQMMPADGLIAAIGGAFCWAAVLTVFLTLPEAK